MEQRIKSQKPHEQHWNLRSVSVSEWHVSKINTRHLPRASEFVRATSTRHCARRWPCAPSCGSWEWHIARSWTPSDSWRRSVKGTSSVRASVVATLLHVQTARTCQWASTNEWTLNAGSSFDNRAWGLQWNMTGLDTCQKLRVQTLSRYYSAY